jgi:hypothetical protein
MVISNMYSPVRRDNISSGVDNDDYDYIQEEEDDDDDDDDEIDQILDIDVFDDIENGFDDLYGTKRVEITTLRRSKSDIVRRHDSGWKMKLYPSRQIRLPVTRHMTGWQVSFF